MIRRIVLRFLVHSISVCASVWLIFYGLDDLDGYWMVLVIGIGFLVVNLVIGVSIVVNELLRLNRRNVED